MNSINKFECEWQKYPHDLHTTMFDNKLASAVHSETVKSVHGLVSSIDRRVLFVCGSEKKKSYFGVPRVALVSNTPTYLTLLYFFSFFLMCATIECSCCACDQSFLSYTRCSHMIWLFSLFGSIHLCYIVMNHKWWRNSWSISGNSMEITAAL